MTWIIVGIIVFVLFSLLTLMAFISLYSERRHLRGWEPPLSIKIALLSVCIAGGIVVYGEHEGWFKPTSAISL